MAAKKTQKKTTAKRKATSKKPAAKGKKPAAKTAGSLLGFVFKWAFVIGFWGLLVVGIICAYYATELPDITENASFERRASIIVKAENGTIIARYGDLVGNQITIDEIPPHLVSAVLATEDRRFYSHFGIDPIGFARAMYVNIRERRFAQGGSTITQQLAKNLFLSQERTIKRKIQEAMLSVWLERQLSKDEILSAYLNRVYLGGGTYGVDAASRLYFNKPVQQVNLEEAAMLAGLLKAPTTYSPRANPQNARKRASVVINAMIDAGYISEDDKNRINASIPKPARKPDGDAQKYYADWIVDEVNTLIGKPQDDLVIETTLNVDIQNIAEDKLASVIRENGEEKQVSQGAIVVMRPNGAVVALIGGDNYRVSQFNRATQAVRQPGSAFKPIVYLSAIEKGWRPDDILMDEPITQGRYRPKNFGNNYYGEVSILEALTYSLNTIAYQLIKDITPDAAIDTARRLGITAPLNADLSLALGTNQISPLELTGAYASIANGGVQVAPYGILTITGSDGTLYYSRASDTRLNKRTISPAAISMLISMMQNVIQNGTGRGAYFGDDGAAGKTGTSQDSRDAWFIGFTDRLVTTVWLGNDDNSPMKRVTGGSLPTEIWRDVMAQSNDIYAPFRYKIPLFARFESLLSRWTGFSSDRSDAQKSRESRVSRAGSTTNNQREEQERFSNRIPNSTRYNN